MTYFYLRIPKKHKGDITCNRLYIPPRWNIINKQTYVDNKIAWLNRVYVDWNYIEVPASCVRRVYGRDRFNLISMGLVEIQIWPLKLNIENKIL